MGKAAGFGFLPWLLFPWGSSWCLLAAAAPWCCQPWAARNVRMDLRIKTEISPVWVCSVPVSTLWNTGESVVFAPAGGFFVFPIWYSSWKDWVSNLMLGIKSLKCGWEDELLLLCLGEKLQLWMVVLCCRGAAFAGWARWWNHRMVWAGKDFKIIWSCSDKSAGLTAELQLCQQLSAEVFYTTKILKIKTAVSYSYRT